MSVPKLEAASGDRVPEDSLQGLGRRRMGGRARGRAARAEQRREGEWCGASGGRESLRGCQGEPDPPPASEHSAGRRAAKGLLEPEGRGAR